MTTLSLEFENADDLEEAVTHLWERLKLTGELLTRPLPDGRWRLEVAAEKPLRAATLERLKGRRVED